jgi:hypothetical protein
MSKGNLSMTQHNSRVDVTAAETVSTTLLLPRFSDDELPPDDSRGLGDEEWPAQTVKRGVHLRMPTAILLALLLAAGGLWGGSLLQKHQGGATGATALGAARAGFPRTGAAGATGTRAGATSSATTGTVTDIIGNTLYVTDSSGSLVKVTLSSSATVTRNAKSSLSALKPGDTVTVQGTTPKDGSMTASSVSATEAGVTSTAGGGGFGGAFAGRSGASS